MLVREWLFVNFLAENLPGINGVDALIGCTFFLFCLGGNWNRTVVTTGRAGLITRVKLILLFICTSSKSVENSSVKRQVYRMVMISSGSTGFEEVVLKQINTKLGRFDNHARTKSCNL